MPGRGMLLASRYRLERRVAASGAGDAWRASDLATGHPVAVRLVRTARAGHFLAAARRAAQVSHPGLTRVRDYGRTSPDGTTFVVTDPVGSSSLAAVMQAGPLDPAWVLEVVGQVASALDAVHRAALVHDDIRPWTLMLAPGGTVKLASLGLVHGAGGPGTDLYCLGLVAWRCLTGPSSGAPTPPGRMCLSVPAMPATVPAGIAGLAADLTAADPARRPGSAAEVVRRCRELMAVPMRATEPRRASSAGTTCLLDPPQRSREPVTPLRHR